MIATASELIEPVYAEHDFWSPATPTQTGWYFHWNGQENSQPIPTKVTYSNANKSSRVDAGQLGITKAISCADYGGLWAPLMLPPHGSAQEEDLKSRCISIALQAMMEIKKNKITIFSTFDIKKPETMDGLTDLLTIVKMAYLQGLTEKFITTATGERHDG